MANKTFNLRDGVLEVSDNTPTTPLKLTLALDEGDLTLNIPQSAVIDVRDRGTPDHLRKGDVQYMTFSFSAKYTGLYAAAADTLFDVLTGGGTSWVYTAKTGANYDLADSGDVLVVQLKFTVVTGTGTSEVVEIPNVALPSLTISEGNDYNTIAVNGTSYQELPLVTAGS